MEAEPSCAAAIATEWRIQMNKYEIRTNKKKQAIIAATLQLIQEKGIANSSIKEIADLAHVSQVSIYNYYGCKTQLIKDSLAFIMSGIFRAAEEILTEELPFRQKIMNALSLCSEDIGKTLNDFFSLTALEDPQIVVALQDAIGVQQNALYTKYIEAGKLSGDIDASMPTATILDFIVAFDSMGNTPGYLEGGESYRKDLIKLLLDGILRK